jgi:hypothetical protein
MDLVVTAKPRNGVIAANGEDYIIIFGPNDSVISVSAGDNEGSPVGEVRLSKCMSSDELHCKISVVENPIVIVIDEQPCAAVAYRVEHLSQLISGPGQYGSFSRIDRHLANKREIINIS